jgi:hypothetical protein
MFRRFIILLSALFLIFALSPFTPTRYALSAQEETIVGTLVKHGKVFVLETDEGDYIVKGKNLSKMEGKMVQVTGTISESDKGDTIDAKSVEEIEE